MDKNISFSKMVKSYDVNSEYVFVYNSIYGNGRIIEREFYESISKIDSDDIDIVKSRFDRAIIDEFIDLKFIKFDNINERIYLEKELEERGEKIRTGCYFDRIHLSTTNKCNMNCKYCFCNTFNYENSTQNTRFPQNKMEFSIAKESIEKSIEVIKSNNKKTLSVEFFGGEPFLNPELIKDVLEYFKNGEEYGIYIEYGCTSNGTYIPDELLKYLKEYNVRVALSIDYINSKTQEYRGGGNNNYKWSDIDENIKKLCENDIKVEIQSVLSEETWNKYSYELIDYAEKMKIEHIGIILSFDFDFFEKYSSEKISERVLNMFDYASEKHITLGGYWYQTFWGIANPDLWEERRAWKSCPTIGRLLSVETNGDVYACKTTSKKLGNISDFNAIFSGENYKYYGMRAYSNSDECIGCELEGFCSGSCTGAIENKFDNIYKTDSGYCKTIKLLVEGLLKRHLKEIGENLDY